MVGQGAVSVDARLSAAPIGAAHVSRLIAAMGNALDGPGVALAEVIASRAWEGDRLAPSSLNQIVNIRRENQPI
jgi:hypothetical protein